LMLLGRTFSPREAVSLGLASECVDGPVLPRALQLAQELAAKSPRALACIKQLVYGSAELAQGLGKRLPMTTAVAGWPVARSA